MLNSKFYLFFIFTVIALYSKGQETEIGVRAGLNVSTLGTDESGFNPRIGYQGGFYYQNSFYQDFFFRTELLFSLQGAQNSFVSEIKNNYFYINFPLMLSYRFQDPLQFEAGVQPGYLIKAVERDPVNSRDIKSEVRNFDLGLSVGLQYQSFVNISIRYTGGLINTAKSSPATQIKFKNKVLMISVSKYLFKKTKDSSTPPE